MCAGDDGALLEAVRSGSSAAFAELYARHRAAARTMAKQVAATPADVDDLVSEAFANILDVLQRGAGPVTAFRAYLLTAIRNLAAAASSRDRRVLLAAELDGSQLDETLPFVDPAVAELERNLVKQAFSRLPRRWRHVLWCVEVEKQTPAEVGRHFGISRNSAAALTYRARKGLREAYTQVCQGEPTQRRLAAPGELLAAA
ncbi:RNA polymerase sigma factor [Saccharopolyspora sp. NPDC002376]